MERIPLPSLGNEYARDTVYYNIAAGNWSRGLNLFALAAIVDLAAEILLGVIVVQMLLKGISMFAGTKGKTVCRLLSSFIRYVALFIFLILGASCLGVDRATIITATGAFSLALSLGAQDLIGDVKVTDYALPGSEELAESVVSTLKGTHACVIPHHGAVFYGPSLEVVLAIAEAVEMRARNILAFDSGL